MKKIILLLSFCLLGFFANAQIDKKLQREVKAILEESSFSGYNIRMPVMTGTISVFPIDGSRLFQQVPLTLKGDIKDIQEVHYNYSKMRTGDRFQLPLPPRTIRRIDVDWESSPIETVTYSFDSLHHTVEMYIHTLHAYYYHKRSMKKDQQRHGEIYWDRDRQSLKLKNLAFSEADKCYIFENGKPASHKVLWSKQGDTSRYWQYVEQIAYDSCNRPEALYEFLAGRLVEIHTFTYTADSQIDQEFNYEIKGLLYTQPLCPPKLEMYLANVKSNRPDSANAQPNVLLEFDSLGRIISITHNDKESATIDVGYGGILWVIDSMQIEYDFHGNIIRRSYNSHFTITQTWEYDYDSHGNWIERREYVNGTLASRATREITYR